MNQDEVPISVKEASLRWKWRRRVALTSFVAMVIFLFLAAFGVIDPVGENVLLIRVILDSLAVIVLAWMGVAAVDDISMRYIEKKGANPNRTPPSNG